MTRADDLLLASVVMAGDALVRAVGLEGHKITIGQAYKQAIVVISRISKRLGCIVSLIR